MTDYPYDLGNHHRPVSSSEEAQTWFDRGLNWTFGFNFDEAAACYERAIDADPGCVMAHWGVAYSIGPNYNRSWERFTDQELTDTLARARRAITEARAAFDEATPAEQAMIDALEHRYPTLEAPEDFTPWKDDFATAMREVQARFPDDRDVTTVCVDAMMNRTPWRMWDPRTGVPTDEADTLACRAMLEAALAAAAAAGEPYHPGLLHLYVHLMEMSPTPEVALPAADALRGLVPDAGHLEHMSTHIDVLCGDYQNVVAGNSRAIVADLKYWEEQGPMNRYSSYRLHNYHFNLYGAMFLGRFDVAVNTVAAMHETIPEALLRIESPPMADFLEGYMAMGIHALVRFGAWQDLVDRPLPEEPDLYTVTTAMTWYGKGVANAALGHHEAAAEARQRFEEAVTAVTEDRYIHVVRCLDILDVAREMLAGEVLYHRGDHDDAFAHLRKAVELEDALPYDEPWAWMMPSRHALGALLLAQGHVEEATEAYEADLGLNDEVIRSNQHPDNVWALVGLHECYTRLGRDREAQMIKPRLDFALARADDTIRSSCFCSVSGSAGAGSAGGSGSADPSAADTDACCSD
ncbi:MAG: tetratricopeptide repeat protein [Actinomycetota bacterium]